MTPLSRLTGVRIDALVLSVFLLAIFLLGGSSRADASSLLLLWPLSGLLLAIGLVSRGGSALRAFPVVLALLIAAALTTAVQLVPLPPSVWTQLPGRETAFEVAAAAGLADAWQPISFTPFRTMTSLYALVVPAAVAVWAARCTAQDRQRLLIVLLAIGFLSAFIGLLQSLGSEQSPLYLYRNTSRGSAVGLLANRNHQAVFLCALFPLLAALASVPTRTPEQVRARRYFAAGLGAVLVPFILITGSRAGAVLMVASMLASLLLYRMPLAALPSRRQGGKRPLNLLPWVGGVLILMIMTYASSRAPALDRLLTGGGDDQGRLAMWQPLYSLTWSLFPFGSGAGSFVETYQVAEPTASLSRNYLNHAHNDWLELAMTHGAAGVALLLAGTVLWLIGLRSLVFRQTGGSPRVLLGRAGLVVTALLGLASIVDYPIRAPAMAALMVIAAMWIEEGVRRARDPADTRSVEKSSGSNQTAVAHRLRPVS